MSVMSTSAGRVAKCRKEVKQGKKRGRPISKLPDCVTENFCTVSNKHLDYCGDDGLPPKGTGLYTVLKYFFRCSCGVDGHVTLRTMDSVNKLWKAGKEIPCRICEGKVDSEREKLVRDWIIAIMGKNPYLYTVNDRVVPGNSSADFYFPTLDLIIMVDGEGHTEDIMRGTFPEDQMEIDAAFNEVATRLGMNVLRLHHKDIDHAWCIGNIKRGFLLSRLGERGKLWYSQSFGRMGIRGDD